MPAAPTTAEEPGGPRAPVESAQDPIGAAEPDGAAGPEGPAEQAGPGERSADLAAAAVAARQHGVLSVQQAREVGLRTRQVQHRVESGRWARVGSGVYRVAGAPRTWRSEVMSAVLLAGSGDPGHAAASHGTALHLLDPGRFPRPPKVEVSVEHGRRATAGGAAVHHARDLLPDVTTADGISCTTGVRTTIDRAAVLDEHPLTALVDDVVCAGLAGRSAEEVRAALAG